MPTADKLITVAENVPKVYHAGQLNVLENTSTLKKSASGSAILIDDVSPVSLEMRVKISSDTVADLTAVNIRKQGKNLIPFPYQGLQLGTSTTNGIDFTVYEDGSILINKTATSDITRYLYTNTTGLLGLKSGITISSSKNASDDTQQGNVSFMCHYYDSTGTMKPGLIATTNSSGTKTITNAWKGLGIYLYIPSGKTFNNLLIKPQLEIGAIATAYEPYKPKTQYTPTADGVVNGVTSIYPNTTLTTDTEGVIIDCEYYKDIDASDVIERTVTTYTNPKIKIIGSYAFQNCKALTSINLPNTTSIGEYAFHDCSALTTADFSVVTSIGEDAFCNCSALTTINFPVVTSIGEYAFYDCSALTTADFPVVKNTNVYAFGNCSALTTVNFPVATKIGSSTFYNCSALTTVDFPAAKNIGSGTFYGCSVLTALILRNSTICTLVNKNAFDGCTLITGTGGYIYVPSSLINKYKTATNWVTYASKFRALEDYTVDGTTTGALDESKVSA